MATQTFYPQTSSNQPSSSGLMALQGCVSSLNASLSTVSPIAGSCNRVAGKQSRHAGHGDIRLPTHAKAPRRQPRTSPPPLSVCVCGANKQHFELITETEVKEAQRDLADEVTPQISELLKRAEQSLAKLERKQFTLKSKVPPCLILHIWRPGVLFLGADSRLIYKL
jgi:hypothetical protein